MSDVASTERGGGADAASGVLERAAAGILPPWAEVGEGRREHCARVAALLGRWAEGLELPEAERIRWRAAGWLHDALRDADPAALRELVPPEARDLPGPLLHGPAAAVRLRAEGIDDAELLDAIAYHTVGHPTFGALGRALYAADALEPGRTYDPVWTASLRARMPYSFDAVVIEVAASRLAHQLAQHRALRQESVDFWNSLVRGS